MAAPDEAFEEAELPLLKAEKPGLTHTQLWKKSANNPLNQVNVAPSMAAAFGDEHAEISALPPYSGRPPTRDPHVLGWEEYNRQAGRAKVFDELYFQINDDIQLMEDCMDELNSIFQRIRRQKELLDHLYLKS